MPDRSAALPMGAASPPSRRPIPTALWAAGLIACTAPAFWLAGSNLVAPFAAHAVRAIPTLAGPGFEARRDAAGVAHYESTFGGLTVGLADRGLFAVVRGEKPRREHTIGLTFPDSSGGILANALVGDEGQSGVVNHYVGNKPGKWILNSERYRVVRAREVLPGVDLRLYPNEAGFEYDLVIASGRAPERIRLKFSGIDRLALNDAGDVELHVGDRTVTHHAPKIYARTADGTVEIAAHLRPVGADGVDILFDAPEQYAELVVDPTITYAGFFGGSGDYMGADVSTDASGNMFVGASVQTGTVGLDATLTKLDPAGNILWTTRLGGSGDDWTTGVSTAPDGSVYMAGVTCSPNFPTVNAFQPSRGGRCDAFVARVDSASGAVSFSTYLGGSGDDSDVDSLQTPRIATDASSNVHVAGATLSANFPKTVPDPVGLSGGDFHAFYSKLSPAGGLLFSTRFGGSAHDVAQAISVDSDGNAVIAGSTTSTNFPHLNAAATTAVSHSDAFVAVFGPTGTMLNATTFGGTDIDEFFGVGTDDYGSIYASGYSTSADFPYNPPFAGAGATPDAVLVRFDRIGGGPLTAAHAVPLSGSQFDGSTAVAVDRATGDSYLTGLTASSDFPLLNGTASGTGFNVFAAKLNEAGTLQYAFPFGGSDTDFGLGVALAPSLALAIVGSSSSASLGAPTSGSLVATNATDNRPILAKIEAAPASCALDIDGNGKLEAKYDAELLIRYFNGLRGKDLVKGGATAPKAPRSDPTAIAAYIDAHLYDADGNGTQDAKTDGVLIQRFMNGAGAATIAKGAVGAGARRALGSQIIAWLSRCGL